MPLPIIAAGIVLGASGSAGLLQGYSAKRRIQREERRYNERVQAHLLIRNDTESFHSITQGRLNKLKLVRQSALITLEKAEDVLNKASANPSDDFRNFINTCILPPLEPTQSPERIDTGFVTGSTVTGTATGVGAAIGAYTVAGFGTASTGAAISSLAGAAASNATLAWLGGGALAVGGGGIAAGTFMLGVFVAGPGLLAGSFFMSHKAEEVLSGVNISIRKMEEAEETWDSKMKCLRITEQRTDKLIISTVQLDNQIEELLNSGDDFTPERLFRLAHLYNLLADVLSIDPIERSC